MKPTRVLPDDPALPGLAALRTQGLARAIRELGLGDEVVDLTLWGYSRGSRATLEAHTRLGHVAVKCYAKDPAAEAELYRGLAAAGLAARDSMARVPPLLAHIRDLRVLVIGWLEGPSTHQLIATGQGRRAGELAARWLRCAASLPVKLGDQLGAAKFLHRARKWATSLEAADVSLGAAAAMVVEHLVHTQEEDGPSHLVNGRLYVRHVLDLGNATGIIDWNRFGQGPLEIDAGMFLATLWRSGRKQECREVQAAQAEAAFLGGIIDLVEERRLAWHRAAALLNLAHHLMVRQDGDWLARGQGLLDEAALVIEAWRPAASGFTAQPTVSIEALVPAGAAHPLLDLLQAAGTAGGAHTRGPDLGDRMRVWATRSEEITDMTHSFTEHDLACLRVLWSRGEATAGQVMRDLDRPLSPQAVLALLSGLEKKGAVTHRPGARHHVYRATVGPEDVRRSFVQDFASFADELYEGDMAALVCQLLGVRDVEAQDLARVIARLKANDRVDERTPL